MFFGATLCDYYEASGDRETLKDLSACAYRQMEIAKEQFDEKELMKNGDGFWGFIDWTDGLNKQSAMQGVYIYLSLIHIFLSNYGTYMLERTKKDMPFLKYMDGVVFSCDVQQIKPEVDIYETLLKLSLIHI